MCMYANNSICMLITSWLLRTAAFAYTANVPAHVYVCMHTALFYCSQVPVCMYVCMYITPSVRFRVACMCTNTRVQLCEISCCMLSEMSLMPQGVAIHAISSRMAHFALKCDKTNCFMMPASQMYLQGHGDLVILEHSSSHCSHSHCFSSTTFTSTYFPRNYPPSHHSPLS